MSKEISPSSGNDFSLFKTSICVNDPEHFGRFGKTRETDRGGSLLGLR
jgi:hypothetical protein